MVTSVLADALYAALQVFAAIMCQEVHRPQVADGRLFRRRIEQDFCAEIAAVNDSGVVVTAMVFVYVGPFMTLLALRS